MKKNEAGIIDQKAFGKKMIKELDKILRKANYQNEYQIAQIKEKWRRITLVLQYYS